MSGKSGIDFVITWVDGSDPAWRAERARCAGEPATNFGGSDARFRDWDLLRYWFRGVEKFAPWVDRIHFVTWGHLPPWLNTENPKLHVVSHADFIPEGYRPTFNSNAILLNLHRIPGLSENFVLFNDDVFILRPIGPDFFFRKGKPRDFVVLSTLPFKSNTISLMVAQNLTVINDHFDFRAFVAGNWTKMVHWTLGVRNIIRNLMMLFLFRRFFTGFKTRHSCQAYLRSSFEDVWRIEPAKLDATCRHRFRTPTDLSEWVMRYWQLAGGRFFAGNPNAYGCSHLKQEKLELALEIVREQKKFVECFNDNSKLEDFDGVRARFEAEFARILPDKSTFEK